MKTRGTSMIGCNIRPGCTPGGFTGAGSRKGPHKKRPSMQTINDAAKTFMDERGIEPTPQKDGFLFGSRDVPVQSAPAPHSTQV